MTALSNQHRQQILDHCLAALPDEGCGMLALNGDRVVEVYPTVNLDASPVSYTIPPQEHHDALMDAESYGWRLEGVFHSHPTGPAGMSATDLAKVTDPKWLYVVVSLDGVEPVLTGWCDGETVRI